MLRCPRGKASVLAFLLGTAFVYAVADPERREGNEGGPGSWPGLRGPQRTGVSLETGLLQTWPREGPPLLWKADNLGEGYGSLAVAGGRLYLPGYWDKEEFLLALDARTGRRLWTAKLGPAGPKDYQGAHNTPTVDGNRIYALTVAGDLVCLEARRGRLCWRKNLPRDFGGKPPSIGFHESPLVDGDRLLCTPGGKDATLVALNKRSGAVLWKAVVPGAKAALSSIIAADLGAARMYVQFVSSGVVGVGAQDGKLLWHYGRTSNTTANCCVPVYRDGLVFSSSGFNTGSGLVQLLAGPDGKIQTKEFYFTQKLRNRYGGVVLLGDYLYGFDDNTTLVCLEFKTGKVAWEQRLDCGGFLIAADGRLITRHEQTGEVLLIETTPAAYREKGRFKLVPKTKRSAYGSPVVSEGRLYVRDLDVLYCFDIRRK